jgi:protein-S-isoprenylcysteine O-methyltransferase Ste14
MKLGRALHDPWVWGQLLWMLLVLAAAPVVGRALGVTRSSLRIAIGTFVLGLGIAILLRGFADLGRNLTPATEPLPEGQLVTTGIYRLVRHPIYLGLSLILAGWTGGAVAWWAGLAVFSLSIAYFEGKARVEERWMTQRFPRYTDYRRRTPRILPLGWK